MYTYHTYHDTWNLWFHFIANLLEKFFPFLLAAVIVFHLPMFQRICWP